MVNRFPILLEIPAIRRARIQMKIQKILGIQGFFENHIIVFLRPSSKFTFGFQPTNVSSLVVSGQRLFGSSFGCGWNVISDFDFVISLIFVASSRMVFSWAFPMFTTSPLALGLVVSSIIPVIVSVM